ncbi:uncharacterized protein LOC143205846 [Rhynchophorus ferrugineus]|uniref:uncharacterized protein LOC143205846 n=1 Tax=Rhynchophorus ferrugineus TaxID=354439 RepID=UPI003FCE19F5
MIVAPGLALVSSASKLRSPDMSLLRSAPFKCHLADSNMYCLTCVDRFSRWPEAIPLPDQEAETVARAFYSNWVARFGVPLRITTDQGRQFESRLFRCLNHLMGTMHLRTTAYHPAANGMVERLHRQLKSAIKCLQPDRWTEALPTALLGIRSSWKEDLQSTTAEMVYGEPLRLPGEFLVTNAKEVDNSVEFVRNLRRQFELLRPVKGTRHGDNKIFVFKDLATATEKVFILLMRGKQVPVSIDRLKPAYCINDNLRPRESDLDDQQNPDLHSPPQLRRSARLVRFPDRYQAGYP